MLSLVIGLLLSYVALAEAQQAIFLVRHGDTIREKGNPDVPLSEPGERRAAALSALLKDSGINRIYTTGLRRTVKTAEPLAKLLGIEPTVQAQLKPGAKPNDVDEFISRLRTENQQDLVLVVLHSGTVTALINRLAYPAAPKIPETECPIRCKC